MGASVDSVLGIDVVSTWENNTADWDIVRINATNHPDLFWGMLVGSRLFLLPPLHNTWVMLAVMLYVVLCTVRVCVCCTTIQISVGPQKCVLP